MVEVPKKGKIKSETRDFSSPITVSNSNNKKLNVNTVQSVTN